MKRVNKRWITFAAIVAGALGCAGRGFAEEPKKEEPKKEDSKPVDSKAVARRKASKPEERTVAEERIVPGVTTPFEEYHLCFATTGVIRTVNVREGQLVKAGDKLMVQDTDLDVEDLKLLELDVNNYPILAAEAKEQAAAAEYKAKENLRKAGGGSDLELEQARAEWEVAKIQIKAASQELKQKEAKRDRQKKHIEKMTLVADMAGVVREITNQVGSNVDPTKQVLSLVENDTVQVRVQVPALASLQLKLEDEMWVSYDKRTWRMGTINYMAPQADAASGMRLILVEVDNPNRDPSGLRAFVELPEKLLAAAAAAAAADAK